MPTIAVIPARAGSRGLPGKNKKNFCGQPMVWWTIKAALDAACIGEIVVSTDCPDIEEFVDKLNLPDIKIVARPTHLCGCSSPSVEVVLDVVKELPKKNFVCMLQPTSPLRNSYDLDDAFAKFTRHSIAESLVSVSRIPKHPSWMFTLDNNGLMYSFEQQTQQFSSNRQELSDLFGLNGAIYLATVERLIKYRSFFTTHTLGYEMPKNRSIDVDDENDFSIAEYLMNKAGENHS